MTQLIDKKAVLEAVKALPAELDAETVQRCIEVLSNLPTVDAIPQWIPCSERLPSSEEDVLCDDEGRVTIGYYTDEGIGWHDMHSYRIYPNAWMPLPTPYERKEE